jgi:hypothetical protein
VRLDARPKDRHGQRGDQGNEQDDGGIARSRRKEGHESPVVRFSGVIFLPQR